uniref:Uncharacterized protein n=1 Tax=Globisporangium ultimum (strain ATCC 200006 / CBS 805.95 / DAOM BR144) TaxID=431595 RepID=K3WNA2_GLOUD
MSSYKLLLNPWWSSYLSLECDQMRFAFCEAMEIGEEDLPLQLKMDVSFYPRTGTALSCSVVFVEASARSSWMAK